MTFSEINPHSEQSKAALARAFDHAWAPFIAAEGEAADTPDNRRRLAGRIVMLARAGQADEDLLGEAALIYLRVLTEAARIGERLRRQPSPALLSQAGTEGGHAFGPETVSAMSVALERCLDDLPLRIPSDALQLLSSTIMDDASRGERDPDRLHRRALEALKTRP